MTSFTLSAEALQRSFLVNKLPCDKNHILVACLPKSGSTWLSEALSLLPGYERVHLVPVYDRREQELAFERLLLTYGMDYVAQHHCRFSQATAHCLNAFSVKPVILVRNIFDCIVSQKDQLDESVQIPSRKVGPMAYVPEQYSGWPDTEKMDFIVDMFIPWYFNFFVGWQNSGVGLWVTYERMVADPLGTVKYIGHELSLSVDDADIERALKLAENRFTRKNVGKSGRGNILTEQQKEKILTFASYYRSNDFSLIGL